MQTLRQIDRFWNARQYGKLAQELLRARMEFSPRLLAELANPVATAAMALIRLDELNQGFHPLSQKLIRTIIAAQEGDGGWGDLMVSALCLRALTCNRGQGPAIDRGMAYLATLQKEQGAWPAFPIRRTPQDAYVSAFILFQLADQPAFRAAVRFDDAVQWLAQNEPTFDPETARLWRRAGLRCRLRPTALAVN
jgi:hypothetical protein